MPRRLVERERIMYSTTRYHWETARYMTLIILCRLYSVKRGNDRKGSSRGRFHGTIYFSASRPRVKLRKPQSGFRAENRTWDLQNKSTRGAHWNVVFGELEGDDGGMGTHFATRDENVSCNTWRIHVLQHVWVHTLQHVTDTHLATCDGARLATRDGWAYISSTCVN